MRLRACYVRRARQVSCTGPLYLACVQTPHFPLGKIGREGYVCTQASFTELARLMPCFFIPINIVIVFI